MLAGCLLLFAADAAGAQLTGQLAGVVRDTSGGLLPGATVTVTGRIVVAPRTVVTNDRGRYELDNLPADRYLIEVSLSGFEPRSTAIDIEAVAATLDLVLTVGFAPRDGHGDRHENGRRRYPGDTHGGHGLPAGRSINWACRPSKAWRASCRHSPFRSPLGLAQVTIRGVGTNVVIAGTDPSSTIHLDGVYLARPSMMFMDFLNVERVEVLRGPQGTLYGRNSVGGTINIVTRQPTNALETSARLTAGNYDKLRAEGAVSGPLIKDKVMGNFAFLRGSHAGFVKDLNHPDHPLGSEDTWAGRGQLRVLFGTHTSCCCRPTTLDSTGSLRYAKPIVGEAGIHVSTAPPACGRSAQRSGGREEPPGGGSAKLVIQLNDTTTLNSLTAHPTIGVKPVEQAT